MLDQKCVPIRVSHRSLLNTEKPSSAGGPPGGFTAGRHTSRSVLAAAQAFAASGRAQRKQSAEEIYNGFQDKWSYHVVPKINSKSMTSGAPVRLINTEATVRLRRVRLGSSEKLLPSSPRCC